MKEVNAYFKMLRSILELNSFSPTAHKVDLLTVLDNFHKYWTKYHGKEFRKKSK